MAAPTPVFAQLVVNPTAAEFQASSSHSLTANGVPIVDHYELEFFLVGAAQPFQVQPFGKPAPAGNGLITVNLASILAAFPSPGIVYESTVAAVGPGGTARSTRSNTFQFAAPCSFTVSPTSRTLTSAAGSSTTGVSAAAGCAWTATSNAAWLTIGSGASGSGNGTVTFNATANTSTSQRVGTLTVAGQAVTVTQSGISCTFGVSPTSRTLTSAAGSSTSGVTAAAGCAWTATSNAAWLTVGSGASGSGNGTVTFNATANTSTSQRTGTLTVAGQTVTVIQNGVSCTFGVSPTSASLGSGAGSSTTGVTATAGCAWTALSNDAWLTISGGASGNGTVTFAAIANPSSSQRTGTLTVAGQTVTVIQDGAACTFGVSPTSATLTSAAGSSTTGVTAPGACGWSAVSNSAWLSISGGGSGSGNGTVTFNATANTSTAQRSGTLTVAGQTVTVIQNGISCTFGVSPRSASLGPSAGSSTTAVTAATGCTWTATSGAAWLTISSGASGNGNGTVTFHATANTSTSPRVGTLTVAGQAVTVTQSGISCTFGVSPTSASLTPSAGSSTTAVTTAAGCTWTATSSAAWLTVSSGASGNGNGTVTFNATANTSTSQRVGTLTVAGQAVTVTQSGITCTFGVSPTARTLTAAGGSSTTAVTVASGCTWNATSNAAWLTVSGGATGSGNGTVTFSATTNTSTAQRVGTLTVAGQTVTVTQSGSSCTFGISPTTRSVPAAGGSSNTLVIVTGGGSSCSWTASSNAAWITISSGASGTGNATVTFSASANTGIARTDSLTVAGQTLTVTQAAGASGPSTPGNLRFVTGQ